MNRPPADGIPVSAAALRELVGALARRAGMIDDKADLLAELLVKNDLRGVFSHGSRQIATYARDMRDGKLNPRPEVKIISESAALLHLDGDAGLGYFPCWQAAHALLPKVRDLGVAAAVTSHHGHFGAAGIYTRIAAGAGYVGYATSGHQLKLREGGPVLSAAGGSPMSFAVPGRDEPPLVLDFGAIHDLSTRDESRMAWLVEHMPSTVFRSFGLGTVCQSLGGFLAGVPLREERAVKRLVGANQGALFIFLDPARFLAPGALEREMDEYHRTVRAMTPFPGADTAALPGELEWERERRWSAEAVPVGSRHRAELSGVAAEFGVPVPWE